MGSFMAILLWGPAGGAAGVGRLPDEPGADGADRHGDGVADVDGEAVHLADRLDWALGEEEVEFDVPAVGVGAAEGAARHADGVQLHALRLLEHGLVDPSDLEGVGGGVVEGPVL